MRTLRKLAISWAIMGGLASTDAFQFSPLSKMSAFRSLDASSSSLSFSSTSSSSAASAAADLVVISPPGGIGEVAAIEAAKMGSSVKWFVVSPPLSSKTSTQTTTTTNASSLNNFVILSAQTMESIQKSNGGSVSVAGARADTLLLDPEDADSSVNSIRAWCSSAKGMICVLSDGVEQSISNVLASDEKEDAAKVEKMKNDMMDAIKVAAKEASFNVSMDGMKIAVLPAAGSMGEGSDNARDNKDGGKKSEGGLSLGNLFGGGGSKREVPSSLWEALTKSSKGEENVVMLRYGELFGIPESSPDASPFVGGPRKYPVLRDEYTMRGVRIDPSKTASGNQMMGENSRSSRLAVGEAAVRMANKSVNVKGGADVCLTSLRGMDRPSDEDWSEEFARAQEALKKSMSGELFSASFGSVKSLERLADWLATKWAPAVLKTYDIAGIRVGARPVYASRIGENQVEIVWQELKDFKTTIIGKMVIEVFDNGMIARRAGGDASAGYGSISSKPLAGEDILVRRLAEAAAQAMEKGLATKPAPTKRPKKQVEEASVVTTVVSAGSIDASMKEESPTAISDTAGPRTSGARRPSERKRGKRKEEDNEQ